MEFRQVKYFIGVAEELHFGRAAEKLHVSQPALSQQIKLLESEIGVELFVGAKRTHQRKVELTEAGAVFLAESRRILQLSEQVVENARRIGLRDRVIRLGIYKLMIRDRVLELVKLFASNFPGIELKLIELPTSLAVQEALMEESIDVGATLLPLKYPELTAGLFRPGTLKIILPEGHPRAGGPALLLEELKNEKWIEVHKSVNTIFEEIEQMCRQAGFSRESSIVQEVTSIELLGGLVGLGIGIALVPTFFDADRVPGVVSQALVNADGTPFNAINIHPGVVYKTDKVLPPVKAVVRLLSGC